MMPGTTIHKPKQQARVNIDLHVHTSFGSACAELHNPDTIPESMEKYFMHGIVITEHNLMWPIDKIKKLNGLLNPDQRIYSGIEVSTSSCHVVVIGLDNSEGIYSGINHGKLIELAQRNQAVTILVHPFHLASGLNNDKALMRGFDCIEIASTTTQGDIRKKTIELCLEMGGVPVAGSDAHCSENLGRAFTCFPRLPDNEKDLAKMIKDGLGIPMVKNTNGEPLIIC